MPDERMEKCTDAIRLSKRFIPNFASLHTWDVYSKDLMVEYRQYADEGKDVTKYKALAEAIAALPVGQLKEDMADCLAGLMHDEAVREGYAYVEPSDLEGIQTERRPPGIRCPKPEDIGALRPKVMGAWLGRICGCLLGKSVEGIKTPELNYVLKETGNHPMHRYIEKKDLTQAVLNRCSFPLRDQCYADTIACAPSDDDTNYTVLAAQLIDEYGRGFTPLDVAKCWLAKQPIDAYCTAERVAFRNFVGGYDPPASAIYKNPYREWIGAQIRSDYYGYINPGAPQDAASMAWRDASVSHVKNGIYGSMLVAAMLAWAAVCGDVKTVIYGGLGQIPHRSRLHEKIMEVLHGYENGKTAKACAAAIHAQFDENSSHDWCHTIPNAMLVVMALLYGGLDYGKSICLAVENGFDTDCNGATVGSVAGMMIGAENIPRAWTKPINNRLHTSIAGVGCVAVDDLCDRTMKQLS